jgi:hypothetical protein
MRVACEELDASKISRDRNVFSRTYENFVADVGIELRTKLLKDPGLVN